MFGFFWVFFLVPTLGYQLIGFADILMIFSQGMVGAYVNQGVRLPSDHQAYTLKGCITGTQEFISNKELKSLSFTY